MELLEWIEINKTKEKRKLRESRYFDLWLVGGTCFLTLLFGIMYVLMSKTVYFWDNSFELENSSEDENIYKVGYELDEEYIEIIEAEWDAMKEAAATYGYSANEYVELNYGRGVNEKVFKEMYERYYYAFSYSENVAENEEVSASDIDAYYNEHSENFDSVSYKSYFVSGTADEGEDEKAAMDEARAEAEAVLSGTEKVEFTESNYYVKSSISKTYVDWLFDEARVAGDKEIFETESGYYLLTNGLLYYADKSDLSGLMSWLWS